jgi:glycosyltransferase involved in cell wall biosynthesis
VNNRSRGKNVVKCIYNYKRSKSISNSKKIVIISNGILSSQPRVLMELNALTSTNYEIIVIGSSPGFLKYKFVKLSSVSPAPIIKFHYQFNAFFRKVLSAFVLSYLLFYRFVISIRKVLVSELNKIKLLSEKPDLIILHGIEHLPWVYPVVEKLKCKIILNLHEYYPLEFEDDEQWLKTTKLYYDKLLKKYGKLVDAYFVVCESIISKYKKDGLSNLYLVRNTKPFYELRPIVTNSDKLRMIHHGVCNSSRKIEFMIEVMKFLPENYYLDLMLVPDRVNYTNLINLAKDDHRIRFINPVITEDIPLFINNYDIGIFLLPPVNFNYLNALPNKLFEYIQGRLAIVVSPNPEMKKLVEDYSVGKASKDYTPKEFANTILSISKEELNQFKINSNKAAMILNDEKECRTIKDVIKNLF